MEIISSTCAGSSFVCDDSSSSLSTEFFQGNNFVVGQTYFIRVFHSESVLITSTFTICIQNPTLTVAENKLENFKIYPNPASDYIEIVTDLTIKKVQLFSVSGQLISTEKQNRISMASLPSGFYLVKVWDQNGNTATKKVVKN
jgi:hypothetical protein